VIKLFHRFLPRQANFFLAYAERFEEGLWQAQAYCLDGEPPFTTCRWFATNLLAPAEEVCWSKLPEVREEL
jgi:hypothetical protein